MHLITRALFLIMLFYFSNDKLCEIDNGKINMQDIFLCSPGK